MSCMRFANKAGEADLTLHSVYSWVEDRDRVIENSKDVLEQLKDMQDVGVSRLLNLGNKDLTNLLVRSTVLDTR